MRLPYKQKENGMYILGKSDMDDIAYMFLKEYAPDALKDPQPVGIVAIAEEGLGLTVKYQNLSPNGEISGLIAFGDAEYDCYDSMFRPVTVKISDGNVLIDTSLASRIKNPRKRFTIAHEVSHRLLHRSYHSQANNQFNFRTQNRALIACRSSSIEREHAKRYNETDSDWEEWQADSLAASILMPKDTFLYTAKHFVHGSGNGRPYIYPDTPREIRYNAVAKIADVFRVSHKATEIRLRQLAIIKDARGA